MFACCGLGFHAPTGALGLQELFFLLCQELVGFLEFLLRLLLPLGSGSQLLLGFRESGYQFRFLGPKFCEFFSDPAH